MIMGALGDNPALIGRYLSTSAFDLATFHLRDAICLFLFSSITGVTNTVSGVINYFGQILHGPPNYGGPSNFFSSYMEMSSWGIL